MVTKRQLGIIVVGVTLLGAVGVFGADIFGAGEWSGFGPLQQMGVGIAVMGVIVGLILISLGDRPA
jgi:hypothetical protein